MSDDERQHVAPLKPIFERLEKAEKYLSIVGDALEKVIIAYDGFVDAATFEPLVEAVGKARNALKVYQYSQEEKP